jgi:phenylacetic acid degradation operon negative regulatory protein
MSAGRLFGFTENTLRVTLSRLVSRGTLTNPRRGYYQLSEGTDELNRFVDDWRQGESRTRSWSPGQWLICHWEGKPLADENPDNTVTRSSSSKTRWALESLGFREVRRSLWARPDNLALELSLLKARLLGLSLDSHALILGPCLIDSETEDAWRNAWQPDTLAQGYRSALKRLGQSARSLDGLSKQQAKLESFTLGGEVIHLLAKDPLLPREWLDTRDRERLWQAMLRYDQQGKEVWAGPEDYSPAQLPRPQQPLDQALPA